MKLLSPKEVKSDVKEREYREVSQLKRISEEADKQRRELDKYKQAKQKEIDRMEDEFEKSWAKKIQASKELEAKKNELEERLAILERPMTEKIYEANRIFDEATKTKKEVEKLRDGLEVKLIKVEEARKRLDDKGYELDKFYSDFKREIVRLSREKDSLAKYERQVKKEAEKRLLEIEENEAINDKKLDNIAKAFILLEENEKSLARREEDLRKEIKHLESRQQTLTYAFKEARDKGIKI